MFRLFSIQNCSSICYQQFEFVKKEIKIGETFRKTGLLLNHGPGAWTHTLEILAFEKSGPWKPGGWNTFTGKQADEVKRSEDHVVWFH